MWSPAIATMFLSRVGIPEQRRSQDQLVSREQIPSLSEVLMLMVRVVMMLVVRVMVMMLMVRVVMMLVVKASLASI